MTQTYDIPSPNAIEPYAEPYLDDTLARFRPHETPLLSLALSRARKVKADAAEAENLAVTAESNLDTPTCEMEGESLGTLTLAGRSLSKAILTLPDNVPLPDERIVADTALAEFKRRYNVAYWEAAIEQLGNLDEISGTWTAANFIGWAKAFFSSADCPSAGVLFCGSALIETLHGIDWTGHSEITFARVVDPVGLTLTRAHTLYGDIDIVRDPALDTLDWESQGALLSLEHVSRYKMPADKPGIEICDCLVLDGTCHAWIDGD